jgi:hypothetical protein
MKNLIILFIFIGGIYASYKYQSVVRVANMPIVAYAKDTNENQVKKAETAVQNPTIQDIINEIATVFKKEQPGIIAKMIYVISRESKFNPNAMNWNCRYGDKSMGCKKGDLDKAWSVDCGVMQLNYPGKYCPGNIMDWKTNIALGYQKFKRQGMSAWVASWDL